MEEKKNKINKIEQAAVNNERQNIISLSRIKTIKSVGNFVKYEGGGKAQFENIRLNVVYGDNKVGKTTLVNIFRAISENNVDYIKKRETIPKDGSQKVEITCKETGETKEKVIKFENDKFKDNILKDKFYIFDEKFVQDNIYTGMNITTENKKNLTEIIMGDEGVEIANQIEEYKEYQIKLQEKIHNSIPSFCSGMSEKEISQFCKMEVKENMEDLQAELNDFEKQKTIMEDSDDFIKLETFKKFEKIELDDIEEEISRISDSDFSDISIDVKKLNSELIKNNKKEWVREGLSMLDNNCECPFCKQSLDKEVVEQLINQYKKIFDKKYEDYRADIIKKEKNLETLIQNLQKYSIENNVRHDKTLLNMSIKFVKLDDKTFTNRIDGLVMDVSEFKTLLLSLDLSAFFKDKNSNINKKCNKLDISNIRDVVKKINDNITLINEDIESYNKKIEVERKILKNSNEEETKSKLEKIERSVEEINRKIARLNQDTQCEKYKKLEKQKNELMNIIHRKQDDLNKQQQEFLKAKFASINECFRKFGSEDFELAYGDYSNKGKRPTCKLEVRFKGENISLEKDTIGTLFSESDRRSLALSIFLSCLENNKDKIIVMDDPVVSFDDNRICSTCETVQGICANSQIIVLTHYCNFINSMKNIVGNFNLLQIQKVGLSSEITKINLEDFTAPIYGKEFKKMMDFIHCNTEEYPINKLRIYLENYIDFLYYPSFENCQYEKFQLKERINYLYENRIINDELRNKYCEHLPIMNADSHQWDNKTVSERRNIVENVLRTLHPEWSKE